MRLCEPIIILAACLIIAQALAAHGASSAKQGKTHPVTLGVDCTFQGAIPDEKVLSSDAWVRAVKGMGVQFLVFHLNPAVDGGDPAAQMLARILKIDEGAREHGFTYTLDNEAPNWWKSVEIDKGVNEFDHADGTHRWDIRMEWLSKVLPPAKPGKPALVGVTYDEPEHMQLTSHQYATYPGGDPLDAPCFANTNGLSMEESYNALVASCRKIRAEHYEGKLAVSTEQVWPDMFHIFANAGWTVGPKILKENLSSVVMAISLGAALQYKDSGANWWVSPDLWCRNDYPGHSPAALRSALMMAYWLGADTIYVENLDFQDWASRHPEADKKGSLLRMTDQGGFEMTVHGRTVKEFYTSYVPAHPRTINWRDYRPKVAIVRLPDGAWGQHDTVFRDRLLGNREHPMDEISAEWLKVWPILTHGAASSEAISLNNMAAYPEPRYPFFVPIDSVAVFDHLVTGPVLDSVECFVVCGHALSPQTFEAIRKRVDEGATCIIADRLYSKYASKKLPGKWVVVHSFTNPAIAKALQPFLGPKDVARFQFKDAMVEFRAKNGTDAITVSL